MSDGEAVKGVLVALAMAGTIASYLVFCIEFPRYHCTFQKDPFWLVIIKIWGFIIIIPISFVFWFSIF